MRRALLTLAFLLLLAPAAPAQLPLGAIASENVEFVGNFLRHTDTSGARLHEGYFYITTERDLAIYDVKDPENPVLTGSTLLAMPGQPTFTEEDPDTNGEILVVSNTDFFVYDVRDKANPALLATLPGVDEHTLSCILDCTWVYGSEGAIVDLRDPANPKLAGNWRDVVETGSTHDVTEIAPGLVLTATEPMTLVDARVNPAAPTVLATGETPGFLHATAWPQGGTDDFIIGGGEEQGPGCSNDDAGSASLMLFSTAGWQDTKKFELRSEFRMTTGTFVDGRAAETTWCVHWFDEHPSWANGGMLAIAWYEHGTRFLRASSEGKWEEIGYFLPYGGQTSAVYWITDRILYAADYVRGFDILRWTGDITPGTPRPAAPAPGGGGAKPGTGGGAVRSGPSFSDLVTLPRSCTSARRFRVRVKRHASDPVVRATLRVNGKRVTSARGSARLRRGLRARRLPRKRFSVQVEVVTRSGHKTAGQRIYRGCKRR